MIFNGFSFCSKQLWALNRQDQTTLKMVTPAIVQVLSISSCGNYCVGGAAEMLYVWQVSTGILLATLRRHYQDVTAVAFTVDSSRFVSVGREGLALLWSLETILSSQVLS